ncbi:FecR family protein [Pedobacter nyackensis]|uniref:FecR family protein n=1 Tax=Pedobacter nyackensis TaxID=475255 RepID=UPI00292CF45F|nr:FecR domain-containing protein [Pedobacter nyackensis]
MQEERLAYLFNKYFDKTASAAERDEFLALVDQEEVEQEIRKLMEESYQNFQPEHQPFAAGGREKMLNAIVKGQDIDASIIPLKRKTLWPKIVSAAAVLLIASVGIYLYKSSPLSNSQSPMVAGHDIKPGKNTATLTLADGRKIVLSDAANGELAKEGGVSIQKTKEGKVVYTVNGGANAGVAPGLNTITTAVGEQYQVILPDGTVVWLNAASSLKYPSTFTGNYRKVELTGEGYFEVAKVRKTPFIVVSKGQEVEVLGTHFNINGYPDEKATKTTLLEGTVRVSYSNVSTLLKPGQQSILINGKTKVVQVQTEDVVAWKNGYFMFNNESLEDIMRKVARWYDVEVEYKNVSNRRITFFGTVSRHSNISQVLHMLAGTGEVKFEVEGRRIIVIEK